ncbi:Protein prenyltransferase [Penicillium lagena]|uniref:Protein prenyltransferase n=1 Tax=Penicillium lagena TaxID=94218 RepID=UPI002540272F|nr:Protein prenyltransferase [Penicillium lagena]KAJ5610216.1 Protein prenyltransferase [Penicillium lagena]
MSDPQQAYHQLANTFTTRNNTVLEIEILPTSLGSPFLQDGSFVGITKKALVQAYTVARRHFDKLKHMSDSELQDTLSRGDESVGNPSLSAVTEVMLLFDCEHLTASNWRKRRLLQAIVAQRLDASDRVRALEMELTLLTSYQCSPLHRHTKSPTLWHHRLWTLRQLLKSWQDNGNGDAEDMMELQGRELRTVLRAAELHPRNYYAFSYMRQLYALLSATREDEFARNMLNPVLDWCLAHPRDISGWAFVVYVLEHISGRSVTADALARVLQFARDVGWEGESLWTFADRMVCQFDLEDVFESNFPCTSDTAANVARAVSKPSERRWTIRLGRAKTYWSTNRKITPTY